MSRLGTRPVTTMSDGFRHPDGDGFQPHYADLAWPLVTDFLQRRV
jgi:hypothetical protein